VGRERHGPLRCSLTPAHCVLSARGEAPASRECNDFIDDLFWKAYVKKNGLFQFFIQSMSLDYPFQQDGRCDPAPSSPGNPLKEFVRPTDSDGCRTGARKQIESEPSDCVPQSETFIAGRRMSRRERILRVCENGIVVRIATRANENCTGTGRGSKKASHDDPHLLTALGLRVRHNTANSVQGTAETSPVPCAKSDFRNPNEKSNLRSLANGFMWRIGNLKPPADFDATENAASTSDRCQECGAARALHSGGPDSPFLSSLDPELQRVVTAWDALPSAVRAAIRTLLECGK
jgi:hypothetical protein